MTDKQFHIPDSLPPNQQKLLGRFAEQLFQAYAENLRSIVLYGSLAFSHYVPGQSDINSLLILHRISFGDLETYLRLKKRIQKGPLVAPLLLDQDYIRSSVDVFPIEYLDLKKNHLTIFGDDPFIGMVIDLKNLRLQCEQELKGKLIRLRQVLLEVGHSRQGIRKLLLDSQAALRPTLSALVFLKTQRYPERSAELFDEITALFEISSKPFLEIQALKTRSAPSEKKRLFLLCADYLQELTLLAQKADYLLVR